MPVLRGRLVHVSNERITDIEDPDSPVLLGCLCPKGAATFQLEHHARGDDMTLVKLAGTGLVTMAGTGGGLR